MVKEKEKKIIVCDIEKCTGCKVCEYACVGFKSEDFNIRCSHITTVRVEPTFNAAVSCVLCDDPECVKGCPSQAITYDEKKQYININKDKCVGCGWCVQRCPYGAISLDPVKGKAGVCDFCISTNKNKPRCVEYCPKDALSYEAPKEGTYQFKIKNK